MADDLPDELRGRLLAIEPDYARLAQLGDSAYDILRDFINGEDIRLAERSLVLALHIGTPRMQSLAVQASESPWQELRAALAAKAHQLQHDVAVSVISKLLKDAAPSIRRLSLKTAAQARLQEVTKEIDQLANSDPEPVVQETAKLAFQTLRFQ